MKTPFTPSQFFDIFRNYNETVFPFQIVIYVLALISLFFAFKPATYSNKIINVSLSFLWFWMGIVYHLTFFTSINRAAYLFGGLFIAQGLLLLFLGVFKNRLSFKFSSNIYSITGLLLIFYALVIYPILGYFFGHLYPSAPTFGLPCPTTIFTFGMFLMTDKKCPVIVLIIPLIWSVIGFTAVFNFGVIERCYASDKRNPDVNACSYSQQKLKQAWRFSRISLK